MSTNEQMKTSADASDDVTDEGQVRAAAAFLDSHPDFPKDWRNIIDVDSLDLSLGCSCVCGQATGEGKAWEKFGEALHVFQTGQSAKSFWRDGSDVFASNGRYLAAWKQYILDTRDETPAHSQPTSADGPIAPDPRSEVNNPESCGAEGRSRFKPSVAAKDLVGV